MGKLEYAVKRIHLKNVSSFLIFRPGEAILVDCGSGGSENKILAAMHAAGLDPGMLRLLILTHAHFDHAGSAAKVRELTGCRIMVHRSDAAALGKGYTPLPAGTRWKAKILVALGRTFARRLGAYTGTGADLLVEDSMDLQDFGFPGKVIHTPGHTHGSMILLMEGGELFAGDTFFGLEGKQHFPPFAEDLPALVSSWQKIRHLPVSTIYPAHGKHFGVEDFYAELEGAMKRYG